MKLHRITAAATALVLSSMSVLAINTVAVHAQDSGSQSEEPTAQTTAAEPAATYDYVAQPGDSFTKMARKAVQTLGITSNVSLSQAKIIFAETNITQASGSPFLNEGQKVSIDESLVKTWAENATKLTAEQEAAWAAYVPYVNFNTNNVGQ